MFRKLFRLFCLRSANEADTSSFEDFVDEDLIGKPERMTAARWRARFGEDELVPVALQAGKEKARPSTPVTDDISKVMDQVNDGWVISTTAEIHDPPRTVEYEDIPPVARRRRRCGRCWAQHIGEKVIVLPHGGRRHRLASQ